MEELSADVLAAKRTPFTPQETRDLRTVFDVYDPANKGCVPMNDLRKILRVLGFKCSRFQLQTIIKEEEMKLVSMPPSEDAAVELTPSTATIAVGGDMFFSFDNLLQFVDCLQGDDYDLFDEIKQTFTNLDQDKDGQLSTKDILKASKQVGLRLTRCDAEEMIEEADRNGDGLVSMDEFIQTMKRTSLFK